MLSDKDCLKQVVALAMRAGEVILEVYDQDFEVWEKENQSPLTAADLAAHNVICEGLRNLYPEVPILSEESTDGFAGPNDAGRYWLVDPLDGTKEFIKRNGEFTVNIALIEAGRSVLGVVYAPVLGVTYSAARHLGAWKAQGDAPSQPIHVSERQEGAAWRVVGSRSHAGSSLDGFLRLLGPYELVPMGSSLKLCLVAEGAADLYPRLGPTSLWDTAAAQCIVEQAGGGVVQQTGEPLSYANPATILNPWFIAHGRCVMDWPELFTS